MLNTGTMTSKACKVLTFGLSNQGAINCETIMKGMPELYWQMDVIYDGPTWNYITHHRLSEKTKNKKLKQKYPAGMYFSNPAPTFLKALKSMMGSFFTSKEGIIEKIKNGQDFLRGGGPPSDAKTLKMDFIKGLIHQGNEQRKMTVVGSATKDKENHDIAVYTNVAKEHPGWIDTAVFIACDTGEELQVRNAFHDLTDVKLYLMCPKKKQWLKGMKDDKGVPYFEPANHS